MTIILTRTIPHIIFLFSFLLAIPFPLGFSPFFSFTSLSCTQWRTQVCRARVSRGSFSIRRHLHPFPLIKQTQKTESCVRILSLAWRKRRDLSSQFASADFVFEWLNSGMWGTMYYIYSVTNRTQCTEPKPSIHHINGTQARTEIKRRDRQWPPSTSFGYSKLPLTCTRLSSRRDG